MRIHSGSITIAIAAVLLVSTLGGPSYGASSAFPETTFVEPDPLGMRRPTPPSLTFIELADIPLPGPLPGADPRIDGDRIAIPVAGGIARTPWTPDARPDVTALPIDGDGEETEVAIWVTDPSGRFRYGAPTGQRVEAQKKCKRCKRGWKKKWRLRVAGSVIAPPVVTEKRVFFGSLDNRIYSLKRRNGHRMWVADLQSRLRRPLVLVSGAAAGQPLPPSDEKRRLEIVLALPGNGSEIVAFHAFTGDKLASFELPEAGGQLVGRPLATPDGRIVVARQKYSAEEASLLVLQLVEKAPLPVETVAEPSDSTDASALVGSSDVSMGP